MKKVVWGKLLSGGRALLLAYDQGLEHGPSDFNSTNVDPLFLIDLAKRGKFTGFICQKGIAEQYNDQIKKSKINLIIKLNGKTNLLGGDPISRQICSVKEAIALGAKAVGYTIYIGSEHESEMMAEFAKIEEEAHSIGIPVIAWVYPHGKSLEGRDKNELMIYAARVGLEIGADMAKVKYTGSAEAFKKAVKAAGKMRLVVAGGLREDESLFLEQVQECMECGASGIAIGRNVWQSEHPLKISKKLQGIVLEGK